MNCTEVQSLLSSYSELALDNDCRAEMDKHMQHCANCSEELRLWEESEQFIRNLSEDDYVIGPVEEMNSTVMDRIFNEQTWMAPVSNKSYSFSNHFRRNLALIIAACMAIFGCALFVLLFQQKSSTGTNLASGFMDPGMATAGMSSTGYYSEIPVASISDPLVLKIVPTFPQYYVALSLLGLVMALLTLNWLSRTKS